MSMINIRVGVYLHIIISKNQLVID